MSETKVLTVDVIRAWRGILAFHPEGNDAKMVQLCDSHEALRAEVERLAQELANALLAARVRVEGEVDDRR